MSDPERMLEQLPVAELQDAIGNVEQSGRSERHALYVLPLASDVDITATPPRAARFTRIGQSR
jgi:hypothetical protein